MEGVIYQMFSLSPLEERDKSPERKPFGSKVEMLAYPKVAYINAEANIAYLDYQSRP